MAKKQKDTCSFAGCTNPIKHPKSQLCGACYSWLYYWGKKTPTDVMRRIDAVHKAERRLEQIAPSNVKHIKKAKSA